MFSTDLVCLHFKTWDHTEGTGQTGQDGQVINLDLPNVHFVLYMDAKGCVMLSLDQYTMSSDQPWPCDCPYMVY